MQRILLVPSCCHRNKGKVEYIYIYILAECVALWGEPEQTVHGMKERRAAACSDMKEKRAI